MSTEKNNGKLVAIIAMMFLFAMISFVTNMAAPFGQIWKIQYEWAGMMGNMMNFAAYLFMGIPAGMMITRMGYKKTALVALLLGFVGIAVQYLSSTLDGTAISTYVVYLLGAFICGFCVCKSAYPDRWLNELTCRYIYSTPCWCDDWSGDKKHINAGCCTIAHNCNGYLRSVFHHHILYKDC